MSQRSHMVRILIVWMNRNKGHNQSSASFLRSPRTLHWATLLTGVTNLNFSMIVGHAKMMASLQQHGSKPQMSWSCHGWDPEPPLEGNSTGKGSASLSITARPGFPLDKRKGQLWVPGLWLCSLPGSAHDDMQAIRWVILFHRWVQERQQQGTSGGGDSLSYQSLSCISMGRILQ